MKNKILECFADSQSPNELITNLSKKYPQFFSKTKNIPENFKAHSNRFSVFKSNVPSEIDESISFYTALSRLTIDQSLLDDVQVNFRNHSPFETIDEEKDETFRWYYQQNHDEIYGPLFAHEMDSRYQLGKFNRKTRVKTREDDSYYPFINILKRYCKILKSKKLNLDTVPKVLSNKIKKFKKGEVVRKRPQFGLNTISNEFQGPSKETRTRTYAPRPKFDLNALLKEQEQKGGYDDSEDQEDLDVPPEGRERARTQV
jgi:hypothetical protein